MALRSEWWDMFDSNDDVADTENVDKRKKKTTTTKPPQPPNIWCYKICNVSNVTMDEYYDDFNETEIVQFNQSNATNTTFDECIDGVLFNSTYFNRSLPINSYQYIQPFPISVLNAFL